MKIYTSINEYLNSLEKGKLVDILNDYFANGSLGNYDIPTLEGKDKWMFDQLISLIEELRVNNINTNEFLNSDNLGYKLNGNLGIFDLGFGDYFENFDKEPELLFENLLDKIKSELNIKDSTYIGKGMFGFAHDIGDNKILKITKDKSEAINSMKIIGKKLNYIANIYDVKKFESNKTYYTIILEKLKLDSNIDIMFKNLKETFDEHLNNHLDKSIINDIKNKYVRNFLEDMITIGYTETWDKWRENIPNNIKDEYDFNDIAEISYWIKGSITNNNSIENSPPTHILDTIRDIV